MASLSPVHYKLKLANQLHNKFFTMWGKCLYPQQILYFINIYEKNARYYKVSSVLSMTRTRFELVLPPWKGGVLTTWPTGRGGEGGIWTLAPVTRPTPLAGAPLQPLEYFPNK